MSEDTDLTNRDLSSLFGELEATNLLVLWIDEPEQRTQLKREIVHQVRTDSALLVPLAELTYLSSDPRVRGDVAEMLGWIGHPEAVETLVRLLYRDKSQLVRREAALALKRINAPEAQAAFHQFRAMIRAYPEIVGEVAEWVQPGQVSPEEWFRSARSRLGHWFRVAGPQRTLFADMNQTALWDIVVTLGDLAGESLWCCRDVSCTGRLADELLAVADRGLIISGSTFIHIASHLERVTSGDLMALRADRHVWLAIEVKKEDGFRIGTTEPDLSERFKPHFEVVRSIKQKAD